MNQNEFLKHYGIKGMKWGVRRYQNEDGSLKSAGKKRYSEPDSKKTSKNLENTYKKVLSKNSHAAVVDMDAVRKGSKEDSDKSSSKGLSKNAKRVLIGAGIVAAVAGGVYLYSKYADNGKTIIDSFLGNPTKKAVQDELEDSGFHKAIQAWFKSKNSPSEITLSEYRTMADDDLILSAGQIFHRISDKAETGLRNGGFVSFDPDDVNRYKVMLPAIWRGNGRQADNALYDITMTAKTAIKSPSKKKRIKVYMDMIQENRDLFDTMRIFTGNIASTEANEDFALKTYKAFAANLIDSNNRHNKEYISRLTKMGYNAIIDDNDAGDLSRNPLIVFAGNVMSNISPRRMDGDEILNAAKRIKVQDFDRRNAAKNIPGLGMYLDYYFKAGCDYIAEKNPLSLMDTQKVRGRVETLRNAGLTLSEIADRLNIGESIVNSLLYS